MKRRLLLIAPAVLIVIAIALTAVTLLGRQVLQAQTNIACTSTDLSQVGVTIADDSIKATQPTFGPEICYTFVVRNSGKQAYDFIIKTFVQAPRQSILVRVASIEPGQSQSFNFAFPDVPTGTLYELDSTLPGKTVPLNRDVVLLAK